MTMTRRRLLDDTFKKSVVGNPAIATDSLARMYPGIEMQGWTEQASTTGANLFDQSLAEDNKYQNFDINSNDFSIVQNDEFWITGKIPVKPNTTYTISVNAFGAYYSDVDTPITTVIKEENPFTTPENANYVCLNLKKSNYQFGSDIMLNEGSTALPWEPYTGGQPSPSPDYPQEIVSAGKYNEDTQKWEYTITVANAAESPTESQTVTLTADRPLTKWDRMEKRNGQWGWVYKSAEIESYTDESVPGEYFSTSGQLSVGAQVWYETATETFAPLSESEREAMNALHTYRPTTVLSNQQGCQMTLTYKSRKGMS